jgi:beta-lactamase class A
MRRFVGFAGFFAGALMVAGCSFGVAPVDPTGPAGSGGGDSNNAVGGSVLPASGVVGAGEAEVVGDLVTGTAMLNLRDMGSTTGNVLAVLPMGSWVHVEGPAQNGWVPVTWRTTPGWAFGIYLTQAPPMPANLLQAVDRLAWEVTAHSPGTDLALSVRDMTTQEAASSNPDVKHVSASSAKPIWVAAALDSEGVDSVKQYAMPIFAMSDNDAAGSVIDLIGPDAVNDFMWSKANMPASAFTQWNYGKTRVADNSPKAMGTDNYFTATDVVSFLSALDAGTLLDSDSTQALNQWMTWSPRTGVGGWMGALLPAAAQASMRHKGGWLPPGCCSDDATYNTLNEIGVLQTPAGHHLVIAIFARHASDYWGKQAPFVERAACMLYRAAAQDMTLDCTPAPTP